MKEREELEEEVDIEVCCDALKDSLEEGGLQIVKMDDGSYAEVIPNQDGELGMAINYCPFCGEPRRDDIELDEEEEKHPI